MTTNKYNGVLESIYNNINRLETAEDDLNIYINKFDELVDFTRECVESTSDVIGDMHDIMSGGTLIEGWCITMWKIMSFVYKITHVRMSVDYKKIRQREEQYKMSYLVFRYCQDYDRWGTIKSHCSSADLNVIVFVHNGKGSVKEFNKYVKKIEKRQADFAASFAKLMKRTIESGKSHFTTI